MVVVSVFTLAYNSPIGATPLTMYRANRTNIAALPQLPEARRSRKIVSFQNSKLGLVFKNQVINNASTAHPDLQSGWQGFAFLTHEAGCQSASQS